MAFPLSSTGNPCQGLEKCVLAGVSPAPRPPPPLTSARQDHRPTRPLKGAWLGHAAAPRSPCGHTPRAAVQVARGAAAAAAGWLRRGLSGGPQKAGGPRGSPCQCWGSSTAHRARAGLPRRGAPTRAMPNSASPGGRQALTKESKLNYRKSSLQQRVPGVAARINSRDESATTMIRPNAVLSPIAEGRKEGTLLPSSPVLSHPLRLPASLFPPTPLPPELARRPQRFPALAGRRDPPPMGMEWQRHLRHAPSAICEPLSRPHPPASHHRPHPRRIFALY